MKLKKKSKLFVGQKDFDEIKRLLSAGVPVSSIYKLTGRSEVTVERISKAETLDQYQEVVKTANLQYKANKQAKLAAERAAQEQVDPFKVVNEVLGPEAEPAVTEPVESTNEELGPELSSDSKVVAVDEHAHSCAHCGQELSERTNSDEVIDRIDANLSLIATSLQKLANTQPSGGIGILGGMFRSHKKHLSNGHARR